MTIPVFDGHNDFLLRLLRDPANRDRTWLTDTGEGHLDLPRIRAGGFAGGFFAVYLPSPETEDAPDLAVAKENPPYRLPLPDEIPYAEALPVALAMVGHLKWMERQGGLRIVRSVADIRACMDEGVVAAILHFEGAEAISEDLDSLHVWHGMGLRSLGPVWSRPTRFGHGVPFAFPATPDTGEGLTDAGKRLVAECNALRILVDLSHLNEKGFDDVARLSDAPLVATHSNAHALTPSSRNLTDRQLALIRDTDGMVGLNYAVGFLREDGRPEAFGGFEPVMRHLDHLLDRLGDTRVGLGSDFDGATIPADLADAAGLPRLIDAMRAHGYDEPLIARLAHGNWLRVLEKTWGQ
ncbi:peptidase M19 [Primorskyibacter flagellatus]|uniref:Peptidase M19 n=1 Tax=Primorskyibacter flagellatus TaxID=1387277 RepID=A0A917AAT1_9RHOB|nr:dipeptidase [Primorskyibacter flagellatus]GGE38829.1 peptidase M19 [Primorskyibacter flagellatus]